jgi:hypothetical protein
MTPELLPDSRPRAPKGAKWHVGAWWVPVFCANCGIPYGYVPEENCQFACWLCDKCADTYGEIANTMFMPDEVFWQKVAEAQAAKDRSLPTLLKEQVK